MKLKRANSKVWRHWKDDRRDPEKLAALRQTIADCVASAESNPKEKPLIDTSYPMRPSIVPKRIRPRIKLEES